MLRSKVILICLILPVLAAIGVLGFGIFKVAANHQVFSDSGYILVSPDSAFSDTINESIYFSEGSKFKTQYQNLVVFKDQENRKVTVDAMSFVHYNDRSIGSMTAGVLIDLNDLDGAVMNHYGLSAGSIMERSADGYILDNMGDPLKFRDFLWKIGDTKYLLASQQIQIGLSDSRILEFEDYVELIYYDTGIIRIVTQEGTWQTVSANSAARLANGVLIDLANRAIVGNDGIARLSLEQLVIDSDDNIQILPEEIRKKDPKVPEFDIKTIDGIDGKPGDPGEPGEPGERGRDGLEGTAGKEGKAGAAGLPGEPGEPGITGITGANGANGPSGSPGANGAAGANGANGSDGAPPEEPDDGEGTTLLPSFDMALMEVKSNSVSGSIMVSDEERRIDLNRPFLIQVLENDTGRQVYSSPFDSSAMEFQYSIDKLVPNKEYRITLTADYTVDNVNYTRIFLNKLFTTDSLGIDVRREYSTDSSLALNVRRKDYSDVISADLQLTDKDGNEVSTKQITFSAASLEAGETIRFDGLESNRLYHVRIINIKLSYDQDLVVPNENRPGDFWTLKKAPVLGKPVIVANKRNSCFDMKLESITDLDGAIITFRYEVYEIGYDFSEKIVKTLYTTKRDILPCYIDGTNVRKSYTYRVKVVAECYDNEKKIEYASPLSDLFSMEGNDYPLVLFEKDEELTHHDKITGNIRIDTNGSILTIDAQNPLIISYQSSTGDEENYQVTNEPDYQLVSDNNNLYNIPFTRGNLLKNDNYILSVYGTIDLNDGAGPRTGNHIGSVVVKTDEPKGFRAVLTPESSQTHPIAFRLGLADEDPEAPSSYEASTISVIDINIYNGDSDQISRQSLKATLTLIGENGSYYNSTLKEQLYDEGNSILITEEDFGINPTVITSSKYTVEVASIRDYTRYANDFVVHNNIKTFTKSATLPDLDDINIDDGLVIMPITLANIGQYVDDQTMLDEYSRFDAGIIFGYEVRAAYFDNSTELVDSFEYYVFEQMNYDAEGKTANEFYIGTEPIVKVTKPVITDGIVPGEVFLFGVEGTPGEKMSRGSKFVFTYRAVLNETDEDGNTQYFPDCVDEDVIIRSAVREAPYQVPRFNLYPWVSDADSMVWKYNIHAPDEHALYGGFSKTAAGSSTIEIDEANKEIVIGDLAEGNAYTIWHNITRFKYPYNEITRVNLASQYFEAVRTMTTEETTLSYAIVDEPQFNRYRIVITDDNGDIRDLSKVVALKVNVYLNEITARNQGDPERTITVPLPSIPGNVAAGYLPYIRLEQYVGRTLYFGVEAVYDSGVSGFMGAAGQDRAIQTMPGLMRGNYINLNYNNNGLVEDVTGYAKGSYFHFDSIDNQTVSMSLQYDSLINSDYANQRMNITCDQTGARLEDIGTRPRITLKSLDEVHLKVTGSDETVSSFDLMAFTPTVTLNRGAAYTIETTIDTAIVSWILNGHDAQIDGGNIQNDGGKYYMYFDLYTISDSGLSTFTGEVIETEIQKGTTDYVTRIENLEQNTKYGIKIYYYDADGERVYPIDSYRPDIDPETRIFTFTTNDEIVITPGTPAFTFYAGAYTNKYLQLSYSLNQTLGFDIKYSICKKTGDTYTEVMDSAVLALRDIIRTPAVYGEQMNNERLMMRPGSLYWEEEGQRVYFPFNSTDYYLCMKPVSKSDSSVLLGDPVYVLLDVPSLRQPFYNVRTVAGDEMVTFHISILDSDRVMVGGHYKVKIVDETGQDITPAAYRNTQYYIGNPVSLDVTGLHQDDKAILHIYSVYDMDNSGVYQDGSPMTDITEVPYEALDDASKGYMKVSTEGHPLNELGYDLGRVQIAQTSERLAAVYFTDAVNLNMVIKYIQYVVIIPEGPSFSYSELFTPVTIDAEDRRYYYELSHRFESTGVYQVQIRFMDENMKKLEDRVLTLIKNV